MLYHYVRKVYARKSDAEVLGVILRGVHPYTIERKGRSWVFSAIVPETDIEAFRKCL